MSTLVFVEPDDELSLQALGFAQRFGDVRAVSLDGPYVPAAWAAAIAAEDADTIVAAGSDRGNELLAHVAAQLDQPFAANVTAVDGDVVTRIRWGGSLYEEARLHGSPRILTVAPHVHPVSEPVMVEQLSIPADADTTVRVLERVEEDSGGVSLRDAKVVVSGGRGVGSAEGFGIIEELAQLLGGAVGCSRVVTSAGWRPHTDQVGQTGTKISADLYVACGISGATQHIAGAKGAKKILAINSDVEAPILASADYAVIGDLHEIVPAISAELRRVRSG
jgi:electron transfer flavoprotein alpha subunit